MASISQIPTSTQGLTAYWECYQRLAQAAQANPRLRTNRNHVEKMIAAHRAFEMAFFAAEVR